MAHDPADQTDQTERRTLSMPPDWWLAFELEALRHDMTLSSWIGECCKANLPSSATGKLSTRRTAGRPPKKPKP